MDQKYRGYWDIRHHRHRDCGYWPQILLLKPFSSSGYSLPCQKCYSNKTLGDGKESKKLPTSATPDIKKQHERFGSAEAHPP